MFIPTSIFTWWIIQLSHGRLPHDTWTNKRNGIDQSQWNRTIGYRYGESEIVLLSVLSCFWIECSCIANGSCCTPHLDIIYSLLLFLARSKLRQQLQTHNRSYRPNWSNEYDLRRACDEYSLFNHHYYFDLHSLIVHFYFIKFLEYQSGIS